jgi:hypothetical protein
VARQVISGLELTLSPSEAERLKPDQPINPVAYEYYLRGIDLYSQSDFLMAIQMLDKSSALRVFKHSIESGFFPILTS